MPLNRSTNDETLYCHYEVNYTKYLNTFAAKYLKNQSAKHVSRTLNIEGI